MEIITDVELATYLERDVSAGLTLVVDLTNSLITDHWQNPVSSPSPAPASVRALALTVAARAAANPKGLTSWTRSWDDLTRTERAEAGQRIGLYLTDAELAELNGMVTDVAVAPVGTIHTQVRGWPCW